MESESRVGLLKEDLAAVRMEMSEYKKDVKNFQSDPSEMWTWDYVAVFKVGSPNENIKVYDKVTKKSLTITQEQHFKNATSNVVKAMESAGLKTDMYYSVQKDEIYCRIGATEARLMREADRIDYDLQLDHHKCLEYGQGLGVRLAAKTNKDPNITEDAWFNVFGKYDQFDPEHPYRQELYLRYNTEDPKHPRFNSLFSSTDRLKLTMSIIEADTKLGGGGISFTKLTAKGSHSFLALFPLHEPKVLKTLTNDWFQWKSTFKSPLQQIRGYFGESVGLYFAFLGFYNRSLISPAIIGLIFFIWQLAENRVDVEGIPAYAIFVSLWASLFLEFWKRREAKYRVRWGMSSFSQKEQPRPEFVGEWRTSPVDGRLIEFFPWHKKLVRLLLAQTVIFTLITAVIASVVGVFFFREVVRNYSWGIIVSAIVNAVQIAILNYVYSLVSRMLNAFENHRTDTEYLNALISKAFLFKFVNSYNSLFYIAFVKKHDNSVGGCINGDCLKELQQQLGTIFIANIVISNTVEVVVPMLLQWYTARQNAAVIPPAGDAASHDRKQSVHFLKKTNAEEEFELAPYDGTFDDFDELVIQYGYVSLFVVAFPIAPLAALLNNIVETRVDATKLCNLTRRPEPRGAADIGTWYDVLSILSLIAVITNVAIIMFETRLMDEKVDNNALRVYIFVIAEHLILLIKFAIAYFVPDVPGELVTHLARQEYIVNVLINGMEEEEEENITALDDAEALASGVENADFDWGRVKESLVPDPQHEFYNST